MEKHLHFNFMNAAEETLTYANLKDLKNLLNLEKNLDIFINQNFSLDKYGSDNQTLNILGSKNLIDTFYSITSFKFDIVEKLKNVEYLGLTEKDNELRLKIFNSEKDTEPFIGEGIYKFTYLFLDEIFKMGKFSKFCIDKEFHDLLKYNIDDLLEKFDEKELQFRFLKEDEKLFLRAVTQRYYNYDNNIAIYISLLVLHNISKKNNCQFLVKSAYVSDSSLRIVYEEKEPTLIKGICRAYFGLLVSNDEIKNGELTFTLRYRLEDLNDPKLSFSMTLKTTLLAVRHSTLPNNIISKLENLNSLLRHKQLMLNFIKALGSIKNLDADILYQLYSSITNSKQTLSGNTRNSFKELYDKDLTHNTYSLIEGFDKINQVTTLVDEKVHLERIYYDVINDIVKRQNKEV